MNAVARSYLYVPGDRPDLMVKALARGADALILDLEDAVAPASKVAARRLVAEFLALPRDTEGAAPALWVRLNPGAATGLDLDAVVGKELVGVCLAKAETAEEVVAVAAALDDLEQQRGIEPRTIAISPLLESAAAVLRAQQIASVPRVSQVQVGEADLCADVGVELGPDEREMLWARSQVVFASAAAGAQPPVGPVSTNYTDLDAFYASTLALKRLGYRSRACIHPAQISIVNEVFTPTEDDIARARSMILALETAVRNGRSVFFTDSFGRLVDPALVRIARRVLATAR